MRRLLNIFMFFVLLFCTGTAALAGNDVSTSADDVIPDPIGEPAEDVDVGEILFGHIGDSYGWHITDWNGKHVTIPLPCIVRSSTGWHVFMSSKIEHGHEYEGLFLAQEGR